MMKGLEMGDFYKGYVPTKNKKCTIKFKGKKDLLTLDEVKELPEYAGVLKDDAILIDVDEWEQSEILMNIIGSLQMNCRVYQTNRGRHFMFKNDGKVDKCGTHLKLACGIEADIKVGTKNSYEVIKFEGEERFIEWDIEEGQEYDILPVWMIPVKSKYDFINLGGGDGRNSALFSYELNLQSAGLTIDETKDCIRLINKYVLKEPLSNAELEVILRDEAFAKPTFYDGRRFLHDQFARYLVSEFYIKRINGQLHVYQDGIYIAGYRYIENKMIQLIPDIRNAVRVEVLKYLEIIIPDETYVNNANLIAFNNGILDLTDMSLKEFSPDYVITNKIPWDYNLMAYDELTDTTLDKISCQDAEIRSLLEECIGYCFYRHNELSKSFILTGSGSNGKSTFLDMIKHVLGRQNYVSLDMSELSERFSTSTMFGKLANIGDDISDEFLQGREIASFKKLVSGNDIKAENKGQDVFFFKPTVKLLFSANEIPRVRNKGFQAIKRRLVIVPFNASFSKTDADYNPHLIWDLKSKDCAEYLIQLGVKGLMRVLENRDFTQSKKVTDEVEQFEKDNNPILQFLDEIEPDEVKNHETKEVFLRYTTFCNENNHTPVTRQKFTKEICTKLDLKSVQKRINNKKIYVFC